MRLTFEWLSTAGNCGSYYLGYSRSTVRMCDSHSSGCLQQVIVGRIIWVTVGQRLECATDIRVVVYSR